LNWRFAVSTQAEVHGDKWQKGDLGIAQFASVRWRHNCPSGTLLLFDRDGVVHKMTSCDEWKAGEPLAAAVATAYVNSNSLELKIVEPMLKWVIRLITAILMEGDKESVLTSVVRRGY
jgi:hypothetical protein